MKEDIYGTCNTCGMIVELLPCPGDEFGPPEEHWRTTPHYNGKGKYCFASGLVPRDIKTTYYTTR
jgi:hypothetical protein